MTYQINGDARAYRVPFTVPQLSYEDALAIAHDTGRIASDVGPLLETVVEMLDELDRPDRHFDCLQIAGTNGKTSTARFTAAILRGEGARTALYTSPELTRMEERMEVDGAPITAEAFAHGVAAAYQAGVRVNERRVVEGLKPYEVTPFDLLTVAALVVFAEQRVDVAVLEVGLGGRWDATSATDPVAVAITGIGLDHMRILGNTLAEIAGEKAAIIKPGRTVVLGEGTHEPSVWAVMRDRCRRAQVEPLLVRHELVSLPQFLGDDVRFSCMTPRSVYDVSMPKPAYQPQNAACAIFLSEAYLGRPLDELVLNASLSACPTPGRFDVLRTDPLLMVDACHNPQSCEQFVAALDEIAPDVSARPMLLIAALADKDVKGIAKTLVPAFPAVAVTRTTSERAIGVADLAALVREELACEGRGEVSARTFDSVNAALAWAAAGDVPLVAAGTITLAGEVARLVR